MEFKRGAHTLWDCRYHLVWCPKYRKDLFADKWLRDYAWELFKRIGQEYEVEIEAMEIAEDHLHMLVMIPPKRSVAEMVRVFKSISAREIFEKFPGVKRRLWAGELWKDGYFVRSVGSDVTGDMVVGKGGLNGKWERKVVGGRIVVVAGLDGTWDFLSRRWQSFRGNGSFL